jgi:hypothetical protein
MAAWPQGRGHGPGELLELGDGLAEVIAEDALQNSTGLLVRELLGAQREGDVHLSEGVESPPEVFHSIESCIPSG